MDFPFLLATVAAAESVWQFGLSASAPLLMNTPGHFLEKTMGVMDLRSTIWSRRPPWSSSWSACSCRADPDAAAGPAAVASATRTRRRRGRSAGGDRGSREDRPGSPRGSNAVRWSSPCSSRPCCAGSPITSYQGRRPGPERHEHDAAGRGARLPRQLGGLLPRAAARSRRLAGSRHVSPLCGRRRAFQFTTVGENFATLRLHRHLAHVSAPDGGRGRRR